jgi:hypothetical protein
VTGVSALSVTRTTNSANAWSQFDQNLTGIQNTYVLALSGADNTHATATAGVDWGRLGVDWGQGRLGSGRY